MDRPCFVHGLYSPYRLLGANNFFSYALPLPNYHQNNPNFSSTFFNQSIPSSLSANFFSVLSCNSPGEPFATSSPKSIHSHSSLYHHNSTTHHGYHTNRKCKTVNRPLRIISLNFQSIKNKKPELDLLLDTTKPDVIIGTETWLDSSISSSEYFPASRYNVYRRDRPPK